jgi:glycosyltransferase involved in cell wall biosynthesis
VLLLRRAGIESADGIGGATVMQIGSAGCVPRPDVTSDRRRVVIIRSSIPRPFAALIPVWSALPGWQLREVTGEAAAFKLSELKRRGWWPDAILADAGSVEARHARAVFPDARLVLQCPVTIASPGELPCCDAAVTTSWRQRSRFPPAQQSCISVIHPGVSAELLRPDPLASFISPGGKVLRAGDSVITIVPGRLREGMPRLARMIETLQRQDARCDAVIVADPSDVCVHETFLRGRDGLELPRIHVTRDLPHRRWLDLLRVSAVHVDLSAPLAPVQSLIEAMACGCAVVAADAEGVREVVRHGVNGQVVDGADARALAAEIARLLHDPAVRASRGREAAFTVLREFDTATAARRYARVLEGRPVESDPADWAPHSLLHGGIALHGYSISLLGGN